MRRASALLALVAALAALPSAASATIVGDPTLTIGAGRFAVAGEIDLGIGGDIETNRLWLRGDYGLAPNMDGFLRLGVFDGDFGAGDIDGYGIGAGVRADLRQEKDWHFGGLAQVMYNMGEATVRTPAIPPFFPAMSFEQDVDWFEFDVAGAASFRGAGPLVPYGGAKIGLVTGDPETDWLVTLFGGATYAINPQLSVGGELRIIDDDALGLFVRYAF